MSKEMKNVIRDKLAKFEKDLNEDLLVLLRIILKEATFVEQEGLIGFANECYDLYQLPIWLTECQFDGPLTAPDGRPMLRELAGTYGLVGEWMIRGGMHAWVNMEAE